MMTVESSSNAWKRSFSARACALLGLLTAVFAVGCGSAPKTYFYTLQVPAAPAPTDPRTNYVLGVEHFRAPRILRDDRIVYYESPTQLNFYEYHRWSSDPPTLLSEVTARALRQMQLFAEVRMLPSREPVDYVLKGRVYHFEEVDEGPSGKARVGLGLTLVRSRDHKSVWSAERQVEQPIQTKGVAGVVEALNSSTEGLLGEVLPGLAAQVERDSTQPGQSQ